MYHNIYKSTTRTPHHHLPSSIVEHSAIDYGIYDLAYNKIKGILNASLCVEGKMDKWNYHDIFSKIIRRQENLLYVSYNKINGYCFCK